MLESTCVSKVDRNKLGSRHRLIDVCTQFWKWFSEVLTLGRCDARKHYAVDNKQAALVGWINIQRRYTIKNRRHTSSFRTSRICLNILAPNKKRKIFGSENNYLSKAKVFFYHLQYSNYAELYNHPILNIGKVWTIITYVPLCMTKTYLPLRCWGSKKSCSSNSTRSLRPFDAMKDSATLRVAGRSWTINFLISGYLNFKTDQ